MPTGRTENFDYSKTSSHKVRGGTCYTNYHSLTYIVVTIERKSVVSVICKGPGLNSRKNSLIENAFRIKLLKDTLK